MWLLEKAGLLEKEICGSLSLLHWYAINLGAIWRQTGAQAFNLFRVPKAPIPHFRYLYLTNVTTSVGLDSQHGEVAWYERFFLISEIVLSKDIWPSKVGVWSPLPFLLQASSNRFADLLLMSFVLLKCFFRSHLGLLRSDFALAIGFKDYFIYSMLKDFHHKLVLPKVVVFNNSNAFARPPWALEIERQQSRVVLSFYSTNNGGWLLPNIQWLPGWWSTLNWAEYLVWDKTQLNQVKGWAIGGTKAKYHVVGRVPCGPNFPQRIRSKRAFVLILDITPVKPAIMELLGLPIEYYSENQSVRFLEAIYQNAKLNGLQVALKVKRWRDPETLDSNYQRFFENFLKRKLVTPIDPNSSVEAVADRAHTVICTPFTSAALLAKAVNERTYYLDTEEILVATDPMARNIEIINLLRCKELLNC